MRVHFGDSESELEMSLVDSGSEFERPEVDSGSELERPEYLHYLVCKIILVMLDI